MNSYVQVISFLVSFIYGIVFYLFARFNKVMLSNKDNVIKFLITLVLKYVLCNDLSICFVLLFRLVSFLHD